MLQRRALNGPGVGVESAHENAPRIAAAGQMRQSRLGIQGAELLRRVLDVFLYIAVVLLGLTFHLLGHALGLLLGTVDQLAGLLLNLACCILERALDLIGVHAESFRWLTGSMAIRHG